MTTNTAHTLHHYQTPHKNNKPKKHKSVQQQHKNNNARGKTQSTQHKPLHCHQKHYKTTKGKNTRKGTQQHLSSRQTNCCIIGGNQNIHTIKHYKHNNIRRSSTKNQITLHRHRKQQQQQTQQCKCILYKKQTLHGHQKHRTAADTTQTMAFGTIFHKSENSLRSHQTHHTLLQ